MNRPNNMEYDFFAPRRITFGWGRRRDAGQLAAALGRRVWLVCGSRTLERNGAIDELETSLREAGVAVERLATISREPEVADVDKTVAQMRERGVAEGDFVLAVGGGSAIDLAKATAALATNPQGESVRDFLEGVGRGLTIDHPPLPLMAMPTTAGTGTECTKNAVISCYDPPFKKSLRSDRMVPQVVLVDPELSTSVPPDVTAHTGMDAITQLLESAISRRSQPIPQALCRQGLVVAFSAIEEAVADGTSRNARERMAHAAMLSGMALANSGLGLAHGVAAALGVHVRVSHGLACAVMLATALRVNRDVRCEQLAQISTDVTGETYLSDESAVDALIERVVLVSERIGIPSRLSEIGVSADQIPNLVASSRGNSMSGNPRDVSDEELHQLLEAML